MSETITANGVAMVTKKWPWRPVYWEPVAGTGERIMVGVVHGFGGEYRAVRTIREDVLQCLFGKASDGLVGLISFGLTTYEAMAQGVNDLATIEASPAGLYLGPLRSTGAATAGELLQTACLLYSSLANLDRLDNADDSDAPQSEEVNRRFSTEVREEVARVRMDLVPYFSQSAKVIEGGQPVKFGFISPRAVIHFTVLRAVQQPASVRDARARLLELHLAREYSGINNVALIAAVPRSDDVTLGQKQRAQLKVNQDEIEREADKLKMRWYGVNTSPEGAQKVVELAG
jgi:hypothetical protein